MKNTNKVLLVASLAAVTFVSGNFVSQARDHHHNNNHHKWGQQANHGRYGHELSRDEAIRIALKRVPGANFSHVHDVEKDQQDDRPVWEGEIHKDGREYEFTVDALSGRIVEWDADDED